MKKHVEYLSYYIIPCSIRHGLNYFGLRDFDSVPSCNYRGALTNFNRCKQELQNKKSAIVRLNTWHAARDSAMTNRCVVQIIHSHPIDRFGTLDAKQSLSFQCVIL